MSLCFTVAVSILPTISINVVWLTLLMLVEGLVLMKELSEMFRLHLFKAALSNFFLANLTLYMERRGECYNPQRRRKGQFILSIIFFVIGLVFLFWFVAIMSALFFLP
jgi:hypothetical protein